MISKLHLQGSTRTTLGLGLGSHPAVVLTSSQPLKVLVFSCSRYTLVWVMTCLSKGGCDYNTWSHSQLIKTKRAYIYIYILLILPRNLQRRKLRQSRALSYLHSTIPKQNTVDPRHEQDVNPLSSFSDKKQNISFPFQAMNQN